MEADSDHSLLEAIALRRDEAAFETLLQRHQPAAFNLAMAMTGRRDRAEEAVQEAMLKIWRSAGTFQPREGSTVRSWLLRVVAREGLMVLRKGKQERNRKTEGPEGLNVRPADTETDANLEWKEALASMQAALQHLAPLDRQLIAMAYGAEMSHREIGRELALSSRTISRRLEDVLNTLRTHLKEAGFAAAVPLVSPHELGTAILSGWEPTPGLNEQILSRLAEAGGDALQAVSQRAAVVKAGAGMYVVLASLAVVAAGGLYWVSSRETPVSIPVQPAAPLPTPVAPAPQKIHARWNFEEGPPVDLPSRQGEWHWVPAQGGRPAGMTADASAVYVPLPMDIHPGKCLEVSLKGTILSSAPQGVPMNARWSVEPNVLAESCWGKKFLIDRDARLISRTFLMEGWEVDTYWSPPARFLGAFVCKYHPETVRTSTVFIGFQGYHVQELEVREISKEEIPEEFRNPQRLIDSLKLESTPPSQRLLPGAKSEEPLPEK